MNNNYRLQLRHGAEVRNFSTRDDVFAYIDGQLQYGGVSLLPYEPILFYYGEDEKNTIIMVGLPEGQFNNGKSYFIIDTADLKEQIDALDEKYVAAIEELKAKDAELQEAIETETEERKAADEAEAEARAEKDAELEKAIEDEAEARAKKDEELQEALNFTKDDLKSVIEACGLIYNEKLADDRVSYEPDSQDEVIRDARDVTEAIDKISKFAVKLAKEMKISVANTDTVNLTLTPNDKDGGNTITADVNIAGTEGLSKKNYDNNIIGKTVEGLYASASLEPSATNPNKLIFKTSGYIDGMFKVDAFETEVDLTAYKGDNGKNTGITVNVDTNENKISAELNLSTDKNNILKLEDGEYVVKGTSKNITYKDGTVFSALNEQSNRIEEIEDTIEFVKAVDVKPTDTDTVSVTVDKTVKGDFVVGANVKLSNDKSIIVSNGGLKADVSASFKKGTSTLFINVGNNEYAIDLSDLAVSVLKGAQYDAGTEELVLEFIVGDTTKTVRVPVGTLIHDVEVDDTDTVDMTLRSVSGGPNHISAEVKIDKTHSDNILTITSNGLYVAKAYITEAVKEEANERKTADNEIKAALDRVSELANSNKEAIATEATTARAAEKANADAIAQEIKDARRAEKTNADAIAENKAAIQANEVAIDAEEGRARAAEQANATAITAEEARAMAAETKNASDINAEITRATEKEADLLGKIGDNTEKIRENKSAIVSEVERATKAEKAIDDKASANDSAIKAEAERAKLAEQANTTAIQSEVNRAMTAETELKADVNKNKTDVAEAKSTAEKVKSDLDVEVTRAMAAEQANATAITAEETRAMTAEAGLKAGIEKNKTDIASAKAVADKAASDLSVEVSRAKAAEEANATAIATEATRATTAEAELKTGVDKNKEDINAANTAISNEVTRAKAVEAELTTKLTDEITRAKAAEAGNATSITTEKERAEHVESDLLEKINKNAADIQTISTEVGDIELRKEGDLSYALYVNGTKHGEFTIPKDQFLKSVTYDPTTRELIFVFNTSEGETTTRVSIADLVDIYAAGEGLSLNGNTFSVDFSKVANASNVYTKDEITTKFTEYAKKVDVENGLNAKANINSVYTKSEIDEKVSVFAKTNDVQVELNKKLDSSLASETYATKDSLSALDSASAKKEYVNTELAKKLDSELATQTYATKNELNTHIQDALKNYATKSDLNSGLNKKIDSDIAEQTYETKDNASATYATKLELAKKLDSELAEQTYATQTSLEEVKDSSATKEYVDTELNKKANSSDVYTKAEIGTQLSGYAKTVDVNNKLSEKANTVYVDGNFATKDAFNDFKSVVVTKSEFETKADKTYVDDNFATKSELETVKDNAATKLELSNGLISKANVVDVYTREEILEKLNDYAKASDVQTNLNEKLNITDAQNVYATKDALQSVKDTYATIDYVNTNDTNLNSRITNNKTAIDNFNLSYNEATSELTYTDKNGNQTVYKLYSGSLIKKGEFNPENNSIVLTIENIGVESQITIPVSELLSDLSGKITENSNAIAAINEALAKLSKDWSVTTSSTVELVKNTVGDKDTLTANVRVSSSNKQAIQSTGDGLYVSKDLEDFTCVFGSTGTISAQTAISTLLEDRNTMRGEIDLMKEQIKEYKDEIKLLKETVNGLLGEIVSINNATGYKTYNNPKNMSERIDKIEENFGEEIVEEVNKIKNELGDKENPEEGTIWYEINNIVDAGTLN